MASEVRQRESIIFGRTMLIYMAGPTMICVLWHVIALAVDSPFFGGPVPALVSTIDAFGSPRFVENILATFWHLGVAFLISTVVGLAIAISLGSSPVLHSIFMPVVTALNAMPKIVIFPVLLLAMGLGSGTMITFAVAHGILVVIIVVTDAIRGLPSIFRKLIMAHRLGRFRAARLIVLPSLIPYVVAAVRMGFSYTFIGLVIAELLTGRSGMGAEILRRLRLAQVDEIAGIVVLIVLMAIIPVLVMRWFEVRLQYRGKAQ